ncbi:probable G-protein coupled receptor 141 isoform X2 [Centroberyx affinis]|uniref:probable G-protein coupled receptor 141 isoform X2 n=1 Tax=Centroberyx affinis TaxID=166261 RepID=UPI003A5C7570
MEVTARSAVLNSSTALPDTYRWALLSIYTLVLVGGSISMSLMINILQSNVRSVTTMAVINLIIVHTLFLLTVPFRIYSYIAGEWRLGQGFCRVVSGMIHAHMYLAFMFYIIILVIRYLAFYKQRDRMEFYRTLHAVGASIAVWLLMLIVALPVAIMGYGSTDSSNTTSTDTYQCFHFELDTSPGLQNPREPVILPPGVLGPSEEPVLCGGDGGVLCAVQRVQDLLCEEHAGPGESGGSQRGLPGCDNAELLGHADFCGEGIQQPLPSWVLQLPLMTYSKITSFSTVQLDCI